MIMHSEWDGAKLISSNLWEKGEQGQTSVNVKKRVRFHDCDVKITNDLLFAFRTVKMSDVFAIWNQTI